MRLAIINDYQKLAANAADWTSLPDGIRTLDTAATALALLGLTAAPEVAGSPVMAAFPSIPTRAVASASAEGGV